MVLLFAAVVVLSFYVNAFLWLGIICFIFGMQLWFNLTVLWLNIICFIFGMQL